MENSWFGDYPEHILPNSSMNSHLPLPSPPSSSVLPCSLSSFEVGLCSWNKRKTACMRTCFSPTYGTLFLSVFLRICFPTLLPGDPLVLWLVLLLTRWKTLRYIAAEPYGQECIYLSNVSELLFCYDTQPSPVLVIVAFGRKKNRQRYSKICLDFGRS